MSRKIYAREFDDNCRWLEDSINVLSSWNTQEIDERLTEALLTMYKRAEFLNALDLPSSGNKSKRVERRAQLLERANVLSNVYFKHVMMKLIREKRVLEKNARIHQMFVS